MLRIIWMVIGLTSFTVSLSGQITDVEPASQENLTWKQTHFFHTLGGTILFDFFAPPPFKYQNSHYTGNPSDTAYHYINQFGFSMLSITYDPRINLYDFNDRASVSVNMPVAFGISIFEPYSEMLSLEAPLLIDFNFMSHSTYNNIDKIGFNAGGGYDFVLAPVTRAGHLTLIDKHAWGTPVFRVGIKGPYKKHNAFVNCMFSTPRKYFDPDENKEFKQNLRFKIVVGILLNYD